MAYVIEKVLEIEAPPALVWEVITDLPRYREWNPFVVECQSTLKPGDPIDMQVRLMAKPQPQREWMLEHVAGQRLAYRMKPLVLGALSSFRAHELEALSATRTRYRSYFQLKGWLMPLVRGLLGRKLEQGFEGMSQGIKRRAENLSGSAPGRGASSPGTNAGAEAGTARAYGEQLLATLGISGSPALELPDEHPALCWARSGLMSLTGRADGPAEMCPAPVAACAEGALAALESLAGETSLAGLRGSQLLAERAAIAGFARSGTVSPGGSCRLLQVADGWIALNLARDDDWSLVPAWLEEDVPLDWEAVAAAVYGRAAGELVARGRLLGLALALEQRPAAGTEGWCQVSGRPYARQFVPGRGDSGRRRPRVLDLSSLWAGPLCSHLLQMLGARVIKLESPQRPDGARMGPPAFYDLLNAGKQSVVVDPSTPRGRAQLHSLIAQADIVIEGSRPRALRQLGLDAEELVRRNPLLTWISISGYGRGDPQENWIAYGDDAGVAAGLSQVLHAANGRRMLCGDAIADPLTGLHAALAAWVSYLQGGGRMIALALQDVVRHCLQFDLPPSDEELRARTQDWSARLAQARCQPQAPRARRAPEPARPLGADTEGVLRKLAIA